MNRYINADKYEQNLRQMTEVVRETGHAPGISGELVESMRGTFIAGVKAAITQLSIEPGLKLIDDEQKMLDGIMLPSKSELRAAALSIREHNRVHSRSEPRAIFITRYLDLAATVLEELANREEDEA